MIRLDSLFRAVKDIDLPEGKKGQARALADAEIKERRRYALIKSQEVTKELRDETSDMYQLYMLPLATTRDRDLLLDTVLQVRRIEFLQDALEFYPNVLLPIPDDASDVEERGVLEQRVLQEAAIQKQRDDYIAKRVADIRKKTKALNVRQLRKMAQGLAGVVAERATMIDAMRWYTVYAGISEFKDGQLERLFDSPGAASMSPEGVVDRLWLEVDEVNSVDPWEIAKNVSTDSGTASLPSS